MKEKRKRRWMKRADNRARGNKSVETRVGKSIREISLEKDYRRADGRKV